MEVERLGSGGIAVNATIIGDRPTGLGVYALGVIGGLAALGERLTVYTSAPEALSHQAVGIVRAPRAIRPERGARGHLARLAWLQFGLGRRLARTPPAVLLNVLPEGVLRTRVPQVTIVHDVLPILYPAEYPRARFYFRYVAPVLLRASRAILVNSERTRRDVLEHYPRVPASRVHVVFAGYDKGRFVPDAQPSDAGGRPQILYVGQIAPHKNLLRLVDAFAMIAGDSRATLVIRGSGRPRHVAALRDRIEARDLGDRVDWQPYESAEGLPRLYRGARMLVLPSLYEGFGLTALEAMASGTPVVASRAASVPEVVGDAALLIDPLDTGALAQAMSQVLSGDALARDLRERGIRRAAAFSWERTAVAVRACLREVIAGVG